jgi:hypothetical protein
MEDRLIGHEPFFLIKKKKSDLRSRYDENTIRFLTQMRSNVSVQTKRIVSS